MTLSSSVTDGRSPAGLKGPSEGTIPKIGGAFLNPKTAIACTSCSLVIASMPFTICFQ